MSITNWNLVPAVSINGIEFGTEHSLVKKALGKPKSVFRKTTNSGNTTDAYADFHVYYSADDRLEAIEFFGRNLCLCIDSRSVFPGTLSDAMKTIPDLVECCGTYVSKPASVGICAEDDNIVSILVGCRDYYR